MYLSKYQWSFYDSEVKYKKWYKEDQTKYKMSILSVIRKIFLIITLPYLPKSVHVYNM